MDQSSLEADCLLAFELSPLGLCLTRERVVEACNSAFAATFGWEVKELIGTSLRLLYASDLEFQDTAQRATPLLSTVGTYSDERIMRRRNGELFWCRAWGRTLKTGMPYQCSAWIFEDLSPKRPIADPLTVRSREVAQLLVTGKTSKEIAQSLGISYRTVEGHRARLMQRLNVSTAGELISRLIAMG